MRYEISCHFETSSHWNFFNIHYHGMQICSLLLNITLYSNWCCFFFRQPQFVKFGGISQNMIESQKEDEYVPQTTLQYLTEESEKESSMRKPRRNKRDMTQLQTILQTNVIPVSQKWSHVLDSIMDKIMKFPELAKILKRYFIDFISFIRTTEWNVFWLSFICNKKK